MLSTFKRWFASKPPKTRNCGKTLVLFVHGLSGSASGTWSPMLSVFHSDFGVSTWSYDCYEFPTALLRLPFFGRKAGVRELANGLDTHIRTYHSDKSHIVLVGHSLGGIVARYYLLEQVKFGHSIERISGLALVAVPNDGAALANVANMISWRHQHLKQLCRGSDLLDGLNTDWVREGIEQRVRTLYITGGTDAVVAPKSAANIIGASNVRTIIGHGHRAIVKPSTFDDIRYRVIRNFLLECVPDNPVAATDTFPCHGASLENECQRAADVLFDVYSPADELYYVQRDADKNVFAATSSANIWVTGPSGVGKTASLRRLICRSGWRLQHIMLASFKGLSATDLIREICCALYERGGVEDPNINADADLPSLLKHIAKALIMLPGSDTIAIFVEEIPLEPGPAYSEFLYAVYQITLAAEAYTNDFRVIWLFSSIADPKLLIDKQKAKFIERVQFVSFPKWSDGDLVQLVDIIQEVLGSELDVDQRNTLVKSANGSPRFVKAFFRRTRNEVGAKSAVEDLIASVAADFA